MSTPSDNEIIQSAINLVNEGLCVTFPVKGYSMLPFIVGSKESVDLVKPENIRVGHVVLAWVEGCRYVVHRIVAIHGNQVVLMGDGNIAGVEHCLLSGSTGHPCCHTQGQAPSALFPLAHQGQPSMVASAAHPSMDSGYLPTNHIKNSILNETERRICAAHRMW